MSVSRNDNNYTCNYNFPSTKLRNVFCTECKHQFFFQECVPLRGIVPLLLECGHIICDRCAKLNFNKPCSVCNMVSHCEEDQKVSFPVNMYALGLMVVSHNRPVGIDDSDICFSKSINSKLKKQYIQGFCYECGIQAAVKCLQCVVLYCFICYSKNQKLLPKFHTVSKCVTECLQRIRHAQKKLKATVDVPNEIINTDSVEATVTQHFAYLHGVLQNVERKIIDSLHQQSDSRNENIDEILLQLKEQEDQLQSALVMSASIADNLENVNLQQVIQKLKKLADMPCYLIINSVPEDQKIKFNVDESIIDAIEKHYTLQIPPVSSFSLQRKGSLPYDYEIEPLAEEDNISCVESTSFLSLKPTSPGSIQSRKIENSLTVGSSEMVRVTHIVNPFCFYVQLMQNQNKIAELGEELEIMANTSGIVPTNVTLNALYVVKCSRNKNWYRGRVSHTKTDKNNEERYTIQYIDYGMKEKNVPLARMRNIIPQIAMLPVMALRCTLFDIVPNNGKWDSDATQAFKKLVCMNTMVSMSIMMITGDIYYVELCAISSKDSGLISVKDSLTYMKYATCVSQNTLMRTNPDSTQTFYKEQLEINNYTDVEILYVESPSCIYVRKSHADRSYFHKLIHDMTEKYEQNESFIDTIPAPCKDLPCAARGVDGFWYRGTICDVTENTVKVFYVDLGYTLILSYDAIRTLGKNYLSCRTQAIKVSLRNIKPFSSDNDQWKPETTEFLKKFLMNAKQFKIIAFEKLGDTYSIAMYTHDKNNVTNLLVKNNLVQSTKSNSPHSATANTKNQKKKTNTKKEINEMEKPAEPYNTIDSDIENKIISDNSVDPFKIQVTIHNVQSPDCIYVSDATCDQTDVEEMILQMQEFYSKFRSAKRNIWSKDTVCAIYSSKNMYYRGRIIDIKSMDKVVVFLYDMGIEETVSMNDIQALYPPFFKIPTYVFKIKLAGILPCGGSTSWPSLSCEELHGIINHNYNSKFYISKLEEEDVENSAILVELWIKQIKMDGPLVPTRIQINSINRMLVEKGVALPIKEYAKKRDKILAVELKRDLIKKLKRLAIYESNTKWFRIDDELNNSIEENIDLETSERVLQYSDLNSDSQDYSSKEVFDNTPSLPTLLAWIPAEPILEMSFTALPTFLDHEGYLYLHSIKQSKKTLQYIEEKLEKVYKNCTIELCDTVWAEGDLCIAQYHANRKWYRGKVLKIRGNDLLNVEFIDYGNVEECSIGTVKKKVILENIPTQCTKCLIHGLNPRNDTGKWRTEDLDKIHGLLVDQKCKVTSIDDTDLFHVINVTLLPNKYCKKKCNLIKFLINEWKIDIEPDSDIDLFENSNSSGSDVEVLKDAVSEYSVSLQYTDAINKNESYAVTNVKNSSELKNIISSTPHVIYNENLSINNKLIEVLQDVKFFEVELCCSINVLTFYAQLKENANTMALNTYCIQYKLLMSDLQENACKQPMITNIVPNMPCCAKFNDNMWYRCLIVETESGEDINDIKIKLLYVDYGNDEYKTINSQKCELYALKKEWVDLPAMAIKCKLWNVEVSDSADLSILLPELEKMYNKRVIAMVKEIDEDFICIELYEDNDCENLIYSKLIEEGLFQIKFEKY
ncbi:tudor domain-containing protein qin isoform X2 [Ptiloglossa arizonensis]|uniref:tudor domain-containing protein qin isoform X2 n=1 Tax=Ptiloglossa arizonensis TaxID=3350558 RepID=UPI003F9EDBF5